MPSVHTIRLRHPWRYELLSGRIRFNRRFNRPTGIHGGADVDLVIDGPGALGQVYLNGVRLGETAAKGGVVRFRINEILQLNNELRVELEQLDSGEIPSTDESREKTLGDVRLEITAAS